MNKQLRKILPIGLVENDLLQVIPVSGEVIERTGGCSSSVASHAGGAQVERDTSSSNLLISFSSWSELGLTTGALLVGGYDYTVGDTVHCAIVHDELNLIAPY